MWGPVPDVPISKWSEVPAYADGLPASWLKPELVELNGSAIGPFPGLYPAVRLHQVPLMLVILLVIVQSMYGNWGSVMW
jgi:hypothetical protein